MLHNSLIYSNYSMYRHYTSCVHSTQQDLVFPIKMSQKIDCFDTAYCSCYLLFLSLCTEQIKGWLLFSGKPGTVQNVL